MCRYEDVLWPEIKTDKYSWESFRPFNKSIIYKSLKRFFSTKFPYFIGKHFLCDVFSPIEMSLDGTHNKREQKKGKCWIMVKTRAAESSEEPLLYPTSRRLSLREGKRKWMNAIFVCFCAKTFLFSSHLHCYININDSLLSNYYNHYELHALWLYTRLRSFPLRLSFRCLLTVLIFQDDCSVRVKSVRHLTLYFPPDYPTKWF